VQEATDRVAIRNIGASETLSQSNTAAAPEGTRLSQVIPEGLRAVSLSVSENSSVANLIRPGDRVDVLVVSNSRTPPAAGRVFPPAQALTVLQNIAVLAVGGATVVEGSNNTKGAVRTVALAVTPRQAAMIALIPAVGNEYLTLRPADDGIESAASPVSTDDLQPSPPAVQRPVAAAAPAAQPRARTRTIEVIAGKSDNVSRVNLAETR
jgi:pilus assembly protein CpaB